MKTILVTGSCGLVGSSTVQHFLKLGWKVVGVDNDTRAYLFGQDGSIDSTYRKLAILDNYTHFSRDIRDFHNIEHLFKTHKIDAVVHAAAQPSHDWAVRDPRADFAINAIGTSNVLESARLNCPEAPFIHISTSKVYGDNPNKLHLTEQAKRFEFSGTAYRNGIDECFDIDQCTHSLFGASKLAGDILAQEYGNYFGMPICVLRPGCITGAGHAGVKLHGFLNYLVKAAVEDGEYEIIGYHGKQVRGNIHANDLAKFFECFIESPRAGEVYNIGGGKRISCSVIEALGITERVIGKEIIKKYNPSPRIGDHICYYSDLTKIRGDYPNWEPVITIKEMIQEIYNSIRD